MTHRTPRSVSTPVPGLPSTPTPPNPRVASMEPREVPGRHRNTGQEDHKELKGRSPADLLDSDFDAVMQAARWRESGDGFALPVVRRSLGPEGVAVHA